MHSDKKRLLLVGGGHAHLGVLRALIALPLPANAQVTLVSPHARQLYSGMLPGWVAGHYAIDACAVALPALAARAGAHWVQGEVTGLDLRARRARLASGETLDFDVVSINTGPVLDLSTLAGAREHAICLRPIEQFCALWPRVQAQFAANAMGGGEAPSVVVIGGGAGGTEIALAIAWRAAQARIPISIQIVAGRAGLLPTLGRRTRRRVMHWLTERGVRLIEDDAVQVTRDAVRLAGGGTVPADATLVATGTAAVAWPRESGLAVDRLGFIGINDRLQSVSHPFVFAAGDCASLIDFPRPRSGVYAVRAGRPLARNLRHALAGAALEPYVPQQRALYLLATGVGHAIADWGGLSWEGRWVWRWKDRIDRAFVAQFNAGR